MSTIDLDLIAKLVNDAGTFAYVEQTGGGVATIYAGEQHDDDEGTPRWTVAAGPGTFGWGQRPSVGDLGDFYVGPDDDGEADPVDARMLGATTEAQLAGYVVALVRAGGKLDDVEADTVDALGLDSTLRGVTR